MNGTRQKIDEKQNEKRRIKSEIYKMIGIKREKGRLEIGKKSMFINYQNSKTFK